MAGLDRVDRPEGNLTQHMGWGSDVAAEMLRRLGIKYVALNPGASYRGLHDSIVNYLGNRDPQMLLCLHEDHAVSIAFGYAKATDEPMGCILHSNVGLMHGLMGIFNAWCSRVPMIILGATGPVDPAIRRPWIDWIHTAKDQGALLRNYVKWDDEPRSPEGIVEAMCRAGQLTRTAPSAPVYVCLDAGLQEQQLAKEVTLPDVARYAPAAAPAAAPDLVERAAELLCNAARPVIMAGRGSRKTEDWDRRVRLAELLGATVVTDLKAAAAFPTDHGLHVGAPGQWPQGEAKDAIAGADAVLALDWIDLAGTFRLVARSKDAIGAKVVHCSLDSYLHNGWSMDLFGLAPSDLPVLADPDTFVAQLLPAVEGRLGGKARWDGKRRSTAERRTAFEVADPAAAIGPGDLGRALSAVRGKRDITLARVSIGWDGGAYDFRHPLDYLGNDGGGGLGSSPGVTIGAALALKDSGRVVVSVVGDGDFLQGGTALWTAARYQIPALWVISNNRSNYNDEVHQRTVAEMRGRPPENQWIGQRIEDPAVDLAAFARAQGIAAEGPVSTMGELVPALERALERVTAGEPFLLDVHVHRGYAAPLNTRGDQ